MAPERIISGGQTGADRAALDVALEMGIACGGWCPRGRRAEDGPIPPRYPLRQTLSEAYSERTRMNVAHSDGTLICNTGELTGGSLMTRDLAHALGKPCLVLGLDATELGQAAQRAREWLERHEIQVLNVAGPRAGARPEIYDLTRDLLLEVLS